MIPNKRTSGADGGTRSTRQNRGAHSRSSSTPKAPRQSFLAREHSFSRGINTPIYSISESSSHLRSDPQVISSSSKPEFRSHLRSQSQALPAQWPPVTQSKAWKSQDHKNKEGFERTQKIFDHFCPNSPFIPKSVTEFCTLQADRLERTTNKIKRSIAQIESRKGLDGKAPIRCLITDNPFFSDNRAAVSAENTIWCINPDKTIRKPAPWPSMSEMTLDGPARVKKGVQYKRFLPQPHEPEVPERPQTYMRTTSQLQSTVLSSGQQYVPAIDLERPEPPKELWPISRLDTIGPADCDGKPKEKEVSVELTPMTEEEDRIWGQLVASTLRYLYIDKEDGL
ncbi:hypothetical protein UCRPC4_g03357 [Phaeomoniella chlamydospora]|uniref:Uncharacterized protein n=1 Tax=Phaeomoniella chlamydospora TaxID=158046 RepID=A0A0G2GZZ4_PHACM|nr:hypothetical protein UCRPC4_g03357 [Phaeomoniella chlamydospora]